MYLIREADRDHGSHSHDGHELRHWPGHGPPLARRGDQVYATMRNLDRARALRDAAAAEILPLTILPLDVDDEGSVQQAIATVLD
jgi:hypothetical protein